MPQNVECQGFPNGTNPEEGEAAVSRLPLDRVVGYSFEHELVSELSPVDGAISSLPTKPCVIKVEQQAQNTYRLVFNPYHFDCFRCGRHVDCVASVKVQNP